MEETLAPWDKDNPLPVHLCISRPKESPDPGPINGRPAAEGKDKRHVGRPPRPGI